jgi:uncharacterized protein (TIGR02266 family)
MASTPLVLPVRFAAAGRVVQTTTRELALDGAFVRCLEPPAPGTEVQLRLYLANTPAPEEIVAVVRALPGERESGFWAEFIMGSQRSKERIGALVAGRPIDEKVPIGAMDVRKGKAPAHDAREDANRRTFPRYNARFAVRFATVQDFVLEYAANISAGGVFVQTDAPPAMGSVVNVAMELPGGGPPAVAKALVVHRVTTDEAREQGVAAGMGVQFVEADDAFRERIDHAIEHILQESAPPAE